ncbi:MAG: hypothetical protein AAF501_19235, partial [Pseudomonadota bacterium]
MKFVRRYRVLTRHDRKCIQFLGKLIIGTRKAGYHAPTRANNDAATGLPHIARRYRASMLQVDAAFAPFIRCL